MNKIVFACNDKMFDGLYLSILSMVRRTKEPIEFYLLSGDCTYLNPNFSLFSKKNEKIISEMVKKYNPKHSFKVIDCTNEWKTLLANSKNAKTNFSPYAMFRLFLDLYEEFDDKVLYIDVDTMANGDVGEFFTFDLGDNEFAACHNYYGRWHLPRDSFNSGVMLFNMPIIRKTKLFEKSRNILLTKEFTWPDQTAMYKTKTKFMWFPGDQYRFNRQQIKMKGNEIIKHFSAHFWGWPHHNNIKQWQFDDVHKYLKIFCFDEDFEIFKKEKERWSK